MLLRVRQKRDYIIILFLIIHVFLLPLILSNYLVEKEKHFDDV